MKEAIVDMSRHLALLVGGSFSALPFLQILQQEGYRVIVAGKDRSEPCHALADGSILVDYSDKSALLRACEPYSFDCIIPTCNDYSFLSSVYVAHKLGLHGFDSEDISLTIHTKQKFKKFTQDSGLKSPRSINWNSLSPTEKAHVAKEKLIVKPDDAYSGIGVSVSTDIETLESAITHATQASRNGKFVIEHFFNGSLHSHSCFLRDHRIIDEFLVDEFCTLNSFQVNCSTYPSRIGKSALKSIHQEIEKLSHELMLADGLLHTQFLWNGEDICIVECMRRCPGDLYGRQMELSNGYPYHFNVIAPFLRKDFRSADPVRKIQPVGRHTVGSADTTLVSAIRVSSPASSMEFVPLKSSGDKLSGERTDKAGILFFIYDFGFEFASFGCDYRECVSIVNAAEHIKSEHND
jgi:hypothetical protein